MLDFVSNPHIKGRVVVWKWSLSHIDKIDGFEHVYKLLNYSNNCQLILEWNVIWTYIYTSDVF